MQEIPPSIFMNVKTYHVGSFHFMAIWIEGGGSIPQMSDLKAKQLS